MKNVSALSWFPVLVQGMDLVSPIAHATWFGGDDDPEDNGLTASGVPTKGNSNLLGCALPMAGYGVKSLAGTPIPHMPFGLHSDGSPNPEGAWVEVTSGLLTLRLPVIDLGPSLRTRHGIDLTVAAFKFFARQRVDVGVLTCSIRILGGARFLQ